jgi:hypothetical protein
MLHSSFGLFGQGQDNFDRKMSGLVLKAGSRPPWVGLAAAVWIQIAAGNAYNFPLYSSALKTVLGLNQQQVTILGVANDVGENFGLLPGIACNKFPPWALLLVGSVLCFQLVLCSGSYASSSFEIYFVFQRN